MMMLILVTCMFCKLPAECHFASSMNGNIHLVFIIIQFVCKILNPIYILMIGISWSFQPNFNNLVQVFEQLKLNTSKY